MTDIVRNSSGSHRFLISGGGTGGHIFPAVSIAKAILRREPEAEILFVGACGRMEMERVPAEGFRIVGLPVAGFDRKKLWRNVKVVYKLWRSMRIARKVFREFDPDMAIGVGGYASGPMLKEAQKAGVPTLLQEQNSYAGVTNKLLAAKAEAICVAYDGMERFFPADRIVHTGNPVRPALQNIACSAREARMKLGLDADRPVVFVTGGSLGARTINESIAAAIEDITAAGAQILWQTGKLYAEECERIASGHRYVHAMPFVSDMGLAYAASAVVVARAGAGTISELQLLGKTAVLVPSPNVAEDHQRKNALALVEKNAAVMIEDSAARDSLGNEIVALLNDDTRRGLLAENVRKMAIPDSDNRIASIIFDILDRKQNR